MDRKIKSEETIYFDQLHINAIHQRFVSAKELKFLILVQKLISRGKTTRGKRKLSKFRDIDNRVKQELIRTIEAEFPNYSLPKTVLTEPTYSTHNHKMAELRELFRLDEFSKHFTQEDFELARNRARDLQNFPAENIQTRISPFDLFLADVKKKGQWTTQLEAGHLWKQLPDDKKLVYEDVSKRVNQEITEFEQDKLPQLLNDPKQFYWLLRVSYNYYRTRFNFSGFGSKEVPFKRRI